MLNLTQVTSSECNSVKWCNTFIFLKSHIMTDSWDPATMTFPVLSTQKSDLLFGEFADAIQSENLLSQILIVLSYETEMMAFWRSSSRISLNFVSEILSVCPMGVKSCYRINLPMHLWVLQSNLSSCNFSKLIEKSVFADTISLLSI